MPARGWRRQPGKAERWVPPPRTLARLEREGVEVKNGTVSRRQYENEVRAKSAGWKSWSEYQRVARTEGYRDARIGAKRQGEGTGMTSPLARAVAGTRREREAGAPNVNRPDGPLADYLVYLGRRDPEDTHDVGQTRRFQPGVHSTK